MEYKKINPKSMKLKRLIKLYKAAVAEEANPLHDQLMPLGTKHNPEIDEQFIGAFSPEGRLVGFFGYFFKFFKEDFFCWETRFFVLPEHGGKGIGSGLVDKTARVVLKAGYDNISFGNNTRAADSLLINFFKKSDLVSKVVFEKKKSHIPKSPNIITTLYLQED